MRTISRIIPFAAIMLLVSTAAWSQLRSTEEVSFKTSADCINCKHAIEEMFTFERGVRHALLDLEKNIVTVRYNSRRTDPEKLQKALIDLGYKAEPVEEEKERSGEDADGETGQQSGCCGNT
ncbi:MAG: heavy-metal-associated domain-containing protein [Marinilabiliales bacterium]|nr:MAG: heavy-metal-associated domain-containing protein [Marinilabiliales bacterium]